MSIKQYTRFLLILLGFTMTAFCASAQKHKKKKPSIFEQEVVSDEKVVKPDDYEKAKAEKAKAEAERKKAEAERRALNNIPNDENTGSPSTGQENAVNGEQNTGNTNGGQDAQVVPMQQQQDLPVDPEEAEAAAKAQEEADKEAERKTAIEAQRKKQDPADPAVIRQRAADAPANNGVPVIKDYESIKMSGKNGGNAGDTEGKDVNGRDYSSIKMAAPMSSDSLNGLGETEPAGGQGSTAREALKMKKIPDSLFLMMERTFNKERPSQAYRIEIYYKGYVVYRGFNGVELKGDYFAHLPRQTLVDLFNMAKDAKFYDLKDAYVDQDPERAAKKQVTYLLMQAKGKLKFVKDGQTDTPSEAIFIEKQIDDALENVVWIPMAMKGMKPVKVVKPAKPAADSTDKKGKSSKKKKRL